MANETQMLACTLKERDEARAERDEWAGKCEEMAAEAVIAEQRARKAEQRLTLADPGQYAADLTTARERIEALESLLAEAWATSGHSSTCSFGQSGDCICWKNRAPALLPPEDTDHE